MSKSSAKRKEPTVRCAIPKKIKFSDPENLKQDAINTEIPSENVSPSSKIHFNLFHEIASCSNLSSIIHWPLASPVCNNSIQNKYCFVSFCSGDYFPVIEKSVMVNKSGKITFGIFGQEISCTVLGIIPGENINLLADNIKEFETINICHGGPRIEEFPNVSSNVCTKSTTGRLKHNQCLQVIKTGSASCHRCRRLRNVLNMQKQRMVSGSRQLAQLSPTKKIVVNELRRVKNNLQKKLNRAKQCIVDLKLELNKVQNEMSKIGNESIKEKLNQCENINESQKILILECFAASKVKNVKSCRYSEHWLMLYLLFNIRSPSAYKYLRSSALLPLPHPKTVRRHLSLIKTTCGFDEDFLKILSKKVERMTDTAKHGVLLFDAVHLRKSLHVNSSTLTYSGLEDFGNDISGVGHKELADNALVFMFQSLGSNFYQTIGCFVSKSEVKGKHN